MLRNVRTDIPCFLGTRIQLMYLKTEHLNEKKGTVIGWREEKKRFEVQLDCYENSVKLIKPNNLWPEEKFDNPSMQTFDKLFDHLIPEHAMQLIENPETLNRYEAHLAIQWCGAAYYNHIYDKNTTTNIRVILEYLLEKCENFPDFQVWIKCNLSFQLQQSDRALCEQTLRECIEHHYGFLPFIFTQLTFPGKKVTEAHIELYYKTKYVVKNRTQFHWVPIDLVYSTAFSAFVHNWAKIESPELLQELNFLREFIEQNDSLRLDEFHSLSVFYLDIARHPNLALERAEKMRTSVGGILRKVGENSMEKRKTILMSANDLKLKAYLRLGNEEMSRKCLKKLKNMFPQNHPAIENYEAKINEMVANKLD